MLTAILSAAALAALATCTFFAVRARRCDATADVARYRHAAQVSALVGRTSVQVRNSGSSPVFEVAVVVHDGDGDSESTAHADPVGPGGDALLALPWHLTERRRLTVRFTDIDGVRWELDPATGGTRRIAASWAASTLD